MERRFVAILAAGIVGYPWIMGVDEEGTITWLMKRAPFSH